MQWNLHQHRQWGDFIIKMLLSPRPQEQKYSWGLVRQWKHELKCHLKTIHPVCVYFSVLWPNGLSFLLLLVELPKVIANTNVKEPFPYVFLWVASLKFKSLIHFKLICLGHVRQRSSLTLLHVNIQFSQHNFLKKLSFLH